jgi:hypothetical protein
MIEIAGGIVIAVVMLFVGVVLLWIVGHVSENGGI